MTAVVLSLVGLVGIVGVYAWLFFDMSRHYRRIDEARAVWADRGSNPEPSDYESRALTIELPAP